MTHLVLLQSYSCIRHWYLLYIDKFITQFKKKEKNYRSPPKKLRFTFIARSSRKEKAIHVWNYAQKRCAVQHWGMTLISTLRRITTFRNLVQSYFVSSFKPVLHFMHYHVLPLSPVFRAAFFPRKRVRLKRKIEKYMLFFLRDITETFPRRGLGE